MTTRAYVPNVDGEGSIGTTDKKWGAMYVASPDSMASDNRVASTAWVQSIVADALKSAKEEIYKQAKLDAHPVGSYYWSNDSTSPAILFGGTWEVLPAGYTLIAQGSGSDSFGSFTYEAGQKYGKRKHPLTTDETPSHSHVYYLDTTKSGTTKDKAWLVDAGTIGSKITDHPRTTEPTGGDQPHNNIQPCIAAYGWRRTA